MFLAKTEKSECITDGPVIRDRITDDAGDSDQ